MKILISALTLISLSAFAQENLNEMKSSAQEHIDSKMSNLQQAKSCIQGAKTKEAFKACKYDMHEKMKMQKEEMKDRKKEKMEEAMSEE